MKQYEEFEPKEFKRLKNGATMCMGVGKNTGMKISKILSKAEAEKYSK